VSSCRGVGERRPTNARVHAAFLLVSILLHGHPPPHPTLLHPPTHLSPRTQVRILGEAYTPDDEEDSAAGAVSAVYAYQARYRVPLTRAVAGSWVLLEGQIGGVGVGGALFPSSHMP
jgi:hypothetical protein